MEHRSVACITGPRGVRSSSERIAGYRQALAAAGIPANPDWVVEGDFQYQSGYSAAQQLFEAGETPSAIFACNDLMAIGAYRYAHENQLTIPGDISIIGFDDIRLAEYTNPPLTTIHQSKDRMGALAAELLLERIANGNLAFRHEIVAVQLVVRSSTALIQQIMEAEAR